MRANRLHRLGLVLLAIALALPPRHAHAEDYEEPQSDTEKSEASEPPPAQPAKPAKKKEKDKDKKTKYMVHEYDRVDAGVFHVGFAVGGNFYIEPKVTASNGAPTGEYFKDFGGQGGVYFDYDYSESSANIPLALRGMLGYKYVHAGTHVFAFDGMVRWMFRWSEKATFGLGFGGSAAVWYRAESTTPPIAAEEIIFLPSVLVGAGFEFQPFMVDFKCLVNRIGEDATRLGLELYFGFRL